MNETSLARERQSEQRGIARATALLAAHGFVLVLLIDRLFSVPAPQRPEVAGPLLFFSVLASVGLGFAFSALEGVESRQSAQGRLNAERISFGFAAALLVLWNMGLVQMSTSASSDPGSPPAAATSVTKPPK